MKQFAFIGVFLLMLAVAMAAMPQMPVKHLGQIMNSGFLQRNAGQQGQQGQGQQHGQPPQKGPNGSGQGQN
ncbi:uncharacterized protein LOC111593946 [Drosophila hydei]|uniref:Uncharacterized protein LOC111593946 n=1 Tax=Drosophila hydei TaxID=7224 RepID=A0A6J1LHL1_DROHY|nr:uncharacterized protein LOC111593946 [Drosophila hydei]